MTTVSRDCYFDNLKFILILLVVIGHSIEPLFRMRITNLVAVYLFLYSFHMPLFIMIAGYFTKKSIEIEWWRKRSFNFFTLYCIFTAIHFSIKYIFYGADTGVLLKEYILVPFNGLWFLLSMAIWYIVTPYIVKSKKYLLGAFLTALVIGYIPIINWDLSLSRTFVFYPLFLVGYKIKELKGQGKDLKDYLIPRPIAIIFLLAAIPMAYYVATTKFNVLWVFGAQSYVRLGHSEWYAFLFRLFEYGIWLFMSFVVASVIPKKTTFFTNWGKNTLYVYLIHEFIFRYIGNFGFYDLIDSTVAQIMLVVMAMIIALLLSSNYIKSMVAGLIDFDYYSFFLKRYNLNNIMQ